VAGEGFGVEYTSTESQDGKDALVDPAYHDIECGSLPYADGWGWLYRLFESVAPTGHLSRRVLCRYFYPNSVEMWRGGLLYKLLGVHLFGRIIPTGGILVRRLTRARMRPYTLAGISLASARAFYYRTCVFESLHLPFLLTLVGLSLDRVMTGRLDLALEDTIINLVANVYPVMHHRRTRMRIIQLIKRGSTHRQRAEQTHAV